MFFLLQPRKTTLREKNLLQKLGLCSGGLMIKCLGTYSLHRRENGRLIHKCHCKGSGLARQYHLFDLLFTRRSCSRDKKYYMLLFGWHSSCICRGCHGSNHNVFNAQFFSKPPESISNVWNCILQGSQVNQKHRNTVHKQQKRTCLVHSKQRTKNQRKRQIALWSCDLLTCLSRRLWFCFLVS